ncbi:NADH:flavin oxidoreductase/NADH oxidase family protein [Nocardioides sp.]|uniref:NADH:flavin oxidoreductase/NADH oxidase family protein n=1 Tax=Nocardioides sp. TaxID=35761 RepID=UPI0019B0D8AC|nr:NADH:flavin oxidoreductase/NADH oxidase family protein [Nocardioides sp.]MBC7277192.1 NADH:flavin oxidoreductase/NADH oxidase family protein [Nocardioides sp.]
MSLDRAPTTALARPLTLPNGVVVPNRLAKAAMSECLGDTRHSPTERLPTLYRHWAEGGAGLVLTGNVMVDRRAIGEVGNVAVEDDRDLPLLQQWATAAGSGGAVTLAQLNHPGRQVLLGVGNHPVAPSPVRVTGAAGVFRTPRELSSADIESIIERFARTAGVMVRAGFGGVQIHAAHGYLVNQFLSPLTNQRTDRWGGDLEGRSRFLIEVVRAVRAEVGAGAVLAVKLNSADFQRGGFDNHDAEAVLGWLEEERVDLVEISGGNYESTAFMGVPAEPVAASTRAREAYFLDFAEKVRGRLSVPLMLTGGFRTAAGMAEALESGAVDIVGLARPTALEPDLPRRLLDGSAEATTRTPRQLGIRRFDGMANLLWHTVQLQRMGRGLPPAPDRHPLINLADYSRHYAPYLLNRLSGASR